jgi:hypothetical protein
MTEETYEQRAAFLQHLYDVRYEEATPLGCVAREIHRRFHFGFSLLRRRSSDAWPRLFKQWGINGAPLLDAWRDWRGVHDPDAT